MRRMKNIGTSLKRMSRNGRILETFHKPTRFMFNPYYKYNAVIQKALFRIKEGQKMNNRRKKLIEQVNGKK